MCNGERELDQSINYERERAPRLFCNSSALRGRNLRENLFAGVVANLRGFRNLKALETLLPTPRGELKFFHPPACHSGPSIVLSQSQRSPRGGPRRSALFPGAPSAGPYRTMARCRPRLPSSPDRRAMPVTRSREPPNPVQRLDFALCQGRVRDFHIELVYQAGW